MLFCVAVGVYSLRRYLYLLMRAEAVANQAVCPKCQTYLSAVERTDLA